MWIILNGNSWKRKSSCVGWGGGAGCRSLVICHIELRTSGQVYTEMLCGGRIAGLKERVLEVIRWIQPVVVVVVNNTEQKLIFLSSC